MISVEGGQQQQREPTLQCLASADKQTSLNTTMDDILSDKFVLKLARKIDPTNDTPQEFSTYLGFTQAEGSCAAIGGNIVQNQRKAYQTILTKYTMVHGRKEDSAVELIKMLLQNEMKDCADLVREELEKFGITVPSNEELAVDHPVSLPTPPRDIPGEELEDTGAKTKIECEKMETD
ncbi:uncharacterized protein LOC121415445 [Lytechinus variegatus]|uniref:uncharacterized protein LOC121415445 n=1 Tax=Lytechinus variegatus TaxID=7654 RepID=UPI001BB2272C|nr:uncharacterized protein LOC121415445 [Lytechinus variegatus]